MGRKRNFLEFFEARDYVRKQNIDSQKQWNEFRKSGLLPPYIPTDPSKYYKSKGWIGYGDWLGTRRIATNKWEFLPFLEARAFIHGLNLKSHQEWIEWSGSNGRPVNIPSNPNATYKDDWTDFGDWLGTENIAVKNMVFLHFEEARDYCRQLGLSGPKEWKLFAKSGKKPDNIPYNPWRSYKDKWKGYNDWLDANNVSKIGRVFLSFDDARNFVRELGLKSSMEWKEYAKSGKKPDSIPCLPECIYKEFWQSYGDWLGTDNISSWNRNYLGFEEARAFIRSKGLQSQEEWHLFRKSSECPDNIPSSPHKAYPEYKSLKDWLGYSIVRESSGHRLVRRVLSNLGLNFKEECCVKISEKRLRFDFKVTEKIFIEFDGIQHFKPVKGWSGSPGFEDILERDKLKNIYCLNNDKVLIRVSHLCLRDVEISLMSKISQALSEASEQQGVIAYINSDQGVEYTPELIAA